MHPLLPSSPEHGEFSINRHPVRGNNVTRDASRPADILTKKIRAVCAPCNNGWMNRLEGKAKVPLTQMVQGFRTPLSIHEQLSVAQWIALKVMVAEHSVDYPVTPFSARKAFMDSGQIPSCYRIYVGQPATAKIGLIRNTITVSLPGEPAPILDKVSGNLQQTCFGLGYVFAVVNASFADGFNLEDSVDLGDFYSMRLWPLLYPFLSWPRTPLLSTSDIGFIAGGIARLKESGHVAWGGDLPK